MKKFICHEVLGIEHATFPENELFNGLFSKTLLITISQVASN